MILKNIGTAALSEEDLSSLTRTRTNMSGIYNSARICPYNNRECDPATQGLTLDPEIEERLASLAATGGSYEEMQYLWVRFSLQLIVHFMKFFIFIVRKNGVNNQGNSCENNIKIMLSSTIKQQLQMDLQVL